MEKLQQAKWIFANVTGEIMDRYFEYYTTFEVSEINDTRLYISAHSQYAVCINGQFVDCGQYDDYEDRKVYDEIAVTEYLKTGENELKVEQYVCGGLVATKRQQTPGVIFEVVTRGKVVAFSDVDCMSRENVKYADTIELLTPQLGFNFDYDATVNSLPYQSSILAEKTNEFIRRPVKKLDIRTVTKGKLVAQGVFKEWDETASKSRRSQHAYFSMCERKALLNGEEPSFDWNIPSEQPGDGVYFVFDLGGESAGLLDFSLDLPEKCEVLVSVGEHLDDLRVRSAIGTRNFTFRYVAEEGRNDYFYPFQRLGLRYIQVLVYAQTGHVNYVGLRETTYPLTHKDIPVTNALHRMIWEVGRNTLELCMHEHYEDCPWREQSQYAMDSRVQILCGYYAFGEYEFPKSTLQLMAHSIREDNLLELCAPGRVPVNIPSFTAVFVREVLEYIEYSGETAFASEMMPVLTRIVEGFESHIADNGLLPQLLGQWNFYEWRDGIDGPMVQKEVRYDSLLNAFVSDAFYCYAKIAEIAGAEDTLIIKYMQLHQTLNYKIHAYFWREECGGYATYLTDKGLTHELTQAMMLYAGVVPEDLQVQVAEHIKSKKLIPCSLSMTIYSYEALLKVSEENYSYVISDIEKVWSKMLRSNTDTFWETDKGADDFDNAGSLCHGWSAVPIYIFAKYGKY